jgi:hypothetical protein
MGTLAAGDEWTYRSRSDATGRVLGLFLAHRDLIELLQGFPEVLLMNCTYKTNRFRMLLYYVTGVTPLLTSYHVAFVFLGQERQCNYEWALEAVRGLYADRGLGAPCDPHHRPGSRPNGGHPRRLPWG